MNLMPFGFPRSAARSRFQAAATSFAVVAVLITSATVAHAAAVFVEPLTSTGLPDDARPKFQTGIEQAFDLAGHELVKLDQAAFRARTDIKKERSTYDLTVRVATVPAERVVIEKKHQCVPCTLDQAEQQLRLLVRTVGLDLSDIADATARASVPPKASPAPPPERALGSMAVEPAPQPAPVPLAADKPAVASKQYEQSRWALAMKWTSILPAVAGVASGIHVGTKSRPTSCPEAAYSACPRDWGQFAVGTGTFVVSELFAVANLVDLLFDVDPKKEELKNKVGAYLGLATAVGLAADAYLLINNDGYGWNSGKSLGIIDLPLAALAATTSIGTLISPGRLVDAPVAMYVAPGMVGVGGTF